MNYRVLTNNELERWNYASPEDVEAQKELLRRAGHVVAARDSEKENLAAEVEDLHVKLDKANMRLAHYEN